MSSFLMKTGFLKMWSKVVKVNIIHIALLLVVNLCNAQSVGGLGLNSNYTRVGDGWNVIPFDKLLTQNDITNVSNGFRIVTAGYYLCSGRFSLASGDSIQIRVQTNGVTWVRSLESYTALDADGQARTVQGILCSYPSYLPSNTFVNVGVKGWDGYSYVISNNDKDTYFGIWSIAPPGSGGTSTNTGGTNIYYNNYLYTNITEGAGMYSTNQLGYLVYSNVVDAVNASNQISRDIRVGLFWAIGLLIALIVVISWPKIR